MIHVIDEPTEAAKSKMLLKFKRPISWLELVNSLYNSCFLALVCRLLYPSHVQDIWLSALFYIQDKLHVRKD